MMSNTVKQHWIEITWKIWPQWIQLEMKENLDEVIEADLLED